jgi:hypothetical protein
MDPKRSSDSDRHGGLAALLDAEEELASLMTESEKEAAAIVAAAEEEARDRLSRLAAEIERHRQALSASIEAGSAKLADSLRYEAKAAVERYERVSDQEVEDLAAFVVAEVIGSTAKGSK